MNTKLLLKVKRKILKYPQLFDMSWFTSANSCGTTHCIGGWAKVFSKSDKVDCGLEITTKQCDKLFYVNFWPEPFRTKYLDLCTGSVLRAWTPKPGNERKVAKVAAERIDYFIATGE